MKLYTSSRTLMKFEICGYILVHLFACGVTWPRYGRPHPLYNGIQQRNANFITNAVLLGMDLKEIQSFQRTFGHLFGLGNSGLLNNGFPMNAYERKRVRQDMDGLSALGVMDSPEEEDTLTSISKGSPDTPDSHGAKTKVGKSTKKSTAKSQLKGNRKIKSKTAKIVNTKDNSNASNKGEQQGRGNTNTSKNKQSGKPKVIRPKRRRNPPGSKRFAAPDSGEDQHEENPQRNRGRGRVHWRNWGEDA